MTDVMRATIGYKRIHKIADIKSRDILESEFGEGSKLSDFNEDILKYLLRDKELESILNQEKEAHQNLMSVMTTRFEEGTYKKGEHLGLVVFCSWLGASLHISAEFLYAWLFKK